MSSWRNNEEEEEEEDEELKDYIAGNDGILFVINSTPSMHKKNLTSPQDPSNKKSFFQASIDAVVNVLNSRIINSENDQVGVLFFGVNTATDSIHNPHESENLNLLYNLDIPDVSRILELEEYALNPDKFIAKFGTVDNYSLSDVLWTCSTAFSSAKKLDTRRVFLITDDDHPDSDNLLATKTRVDDLKQYGIDIKLFPFSPAGKGFDFSAFNDILIDDDEEEKQNKTINEIQELFNDVRIKEVKKRVFFRIPFIHQGLEISVKGFNLIVERKKGAAVHLEQTSNKEVKVVSKQMCVDTAQYLVPTDLKSYYMYGGKKVVFTPEELATIKNFGEPGLVLFGFKDKKSLDITHNIKHSSFILPNEKIIAGSSSLFANLLDSMIKMEKIAICRLIARRNSSPRLVALYPQMDATFQGFHVIVLPFTDDIRDIPNTLNLPGPKPEDELIETAKTIINKSSIDYSPIDYSNPILQKHYSNLCTLALKKDYEHTFEDSTLPPNEEFHNIIGEQMKEFNDMVGKAPESEKKAAKPKPVKKTAAKPAALATSPEEIEKIARSGKLTKLTVAALSAFVETNLGRKPPRKKGDIIDLIKGHFNID